jgi:hypothetical protein
MPLSGPLKLGSSLVALILSVFAPIGRAIAQSAGSVGAVNPSASGTPPGGQARALAVGSGVVRNERLQTSATGTLHVTLNDRTTLNLGPSTNLTIDSYVYDPASGNGSFKASMRSGLLRFVGGQTSHGGNAAVETPVATIGIRGNMVIVRFEPGRGWVVIALGQGAITVRNAVSEVVINRPGFSVVVTAPDAPIGPPTRESPASIETAFVATTSRPGQTGGARRPPTDAEARRAGVGSRPLPAPGGSALDYQGIMSIQPGTARNAAQRRQADPSRAVPREQSVPNPYGNAQ